MNFLNPSMESLVREDHPYRRILELVDFDILTQPLKATYSDQGRGGYPAATAFKTLLLQYMEDISDRELERFLQENLAGKLFCGFELTETTPDYSYFCKLRQRIGTKRLADMFNQVRDALKAQGVIREIFTFVDASHLVSKMSVWEERDKAIKAGIDRLNNLTVGKFSADKQARFGCKGKNKYWFGYKRHVAVDMTHGFITKSAVTPANLSDNQGFKHVCPNQGMVFGDKAYCLREAQREMKIRGCHSGAILKNTMKGKDRDKDRWLTKVRMPYEGVFSKMERRSRYRGIAKNQFQAFMEALSHNLKRLIKIKADPLVLQPV